VVEDKVQGRVVIPNKDLDDLIILRSDGNPTYNLAVVVDDHDMGVTHVIRGVDHLNNAARQSHIYAAMGWAIPVWAHVPLIHGADGAKLSKRHGAQGVEEYRSMGYLPVALRNYLVRLGWSHGDDEIISTGDAIRWFDIAQVGRAPARFDQAKLDSVNAHYIRLASDQRLVGLVAERLEQEFRRALSDTERDRLLRAMPGLKPRAKTIVELADKAKFYTGDQPTLSERAIALLERDRGDTFVPGDGLLPEIRQVLESIPASEWPTDVDTSTRFGKPLRDLAATRKTSFGSIAQLLGSALGGSPESPGLFIALFVFGRDEALRRIDQILKRSL